MAYSFERLRACPIVGESLSMLITRSKILIRTCQWSQVRLGTIEQQIFTNQYLSGVGNDRWEEILDQLDLINQVLVHIRLLKRIQKIYPIEGTNKVELIVWLDFRPVLLCDVYNIAVIFPLLNNVDLDILIWRQCPPFRFHYVQLILTAEHHFRAHIRLRNLG